MSAISYKNKPDVFKVGDLILALKEVQFCDRSWQLKNSKHVVTEETVAYYNYFQEDYKLLAQSEKVKEDE